MVITEFDSYSCNFDQAGTLSLSTRAFCCSRLASSRHSGAQGPCWHLVAAWRHGDPISLRCIILYQYEKKKKIEGDFITSSPN